MATVVSAQATISLAGPLNTRRGGHTATLLTDGRLLVTGGTGNGIYLDSFEIFDPEVGTWMMPFETLHEARTGHTATLLPDGKVLVTGGRIRSGGYWVPITGLEVFDPTTGTWTVRSETLSEPRYDHTATLLRDGRMLLVGGQDGDGALDSYEIMDISTQPWTMSFAYLSSPRFMHTATLLRDGRVLVAGGAYDNDPLDSFEIFDPEGDTWNHDPFNTLNDPRSDHTATLLADGRVLVTGGDADPGELDSVEIFNPETSSWSSDPGSALNWAREGHTATMLPDGRVLVAAGIGLGWGDSLEVYDPDSGIWTMDSETLHDVRNSHTTTLLPDGRVVIAGGWDGWGNVNSTEVYYPGPGSCTLAPGLLNQARSFHTATMLPDGRVLIASDLNTFEIYDPSYGDWTLFEGFPTQSRRYHTATLLLDGRVLVTGGEYYDGSQLVAMDNVELVDPATDPLTVTPGSLNEGRTHHSATLLPDGRVLVAGGLNDSQELDSFEVFDPASGWIVPTETLSESRAAHTATMLPDGRVVLAGGTNTSGYSTNVDIFDPETGTWSIAPGTLNEIRVIHTATPLADGRVLVAGGTNGPNYLNSSEIFDPLTGVWTVTPGTLAEGRAFHTATLLSDGRVVVTGGYQGLIHHSSIEVFEPESGDWTTTPFTLNETRAYHTATFLANDTVLVATGTGYSGALDTAEIFERASLPAFRRPIVTAIPMIPEHDVGIGAPACTDAASLCDSVSLLSGRDSIPGGEETHAPNTIDRTSDGGAGAYPLDETIERIRVFTPDGSLFTEAGPATIEVTVWATDDDELEIWSAADATNPGDWDLLTTMDLSGLNPLPGLHVLTFSFTLPTGSIQAVRGHLSRTTLPGAYDDYDDLVFVVGSIPSPYHNPITPGEVYTVLGTGFAGDSEASDGSTQSSPVNYPITRLRAVESDRLFTLTPDPQANFSDDPMTLTFSKLPPDLDVGWHYLTVSASGVPSVARMVEVNCGSLQVTPPESTTVVSGETATFLVSTAGGRAIQWQECVVGDCEDNWTDIPEATLVSYTTPPVVGADSGTKYRVEVRGSCGLNDVPCDDLTTGCIESETATLTVFDETEPEVEVLYPSGGEYWLLSEAGEDPNSQLISWSMSDDVRICQVDVSLWSSDDGDPYTCVNGCLADGSGLPKTFGDGGSCVHPGVLDTSVLYTIPTAPPSGSQGSRYKVQVVVTDCETEDGVRSTTAWSSNPFYIVEPNPDTVKTLILTNPARMETVMGATPTQTTDLELALNDLANHPRVLGGVVDLGGVTTINDLYALWDADPDNSDLANDVLFAPGGIHELLLDLLEIYSGVEHVVLVGDDRFIPFARMGDGAALHLESNYPAGGDISPTGTTVGQALAADHYLSDDPLVVLDDVAPTEVDTHLFVPDLNIGRLVETHDEITTTVATFISTGGKLDLSTMDPDTGHKVLITGYDFLLDSAKVARRRFKSVFGCEWLGSDPPWCDDDSATAPVDGALVSSTWDLASVGERRDALFDHISGNGGPSYGLINLNGHATHYEEGVPDGADWTTIWGLESLRLYGDDDCGNLWPTPVDLSGAVIYSPGCHGGLPVPGACFDDADHSLDLPQTMLARGAQTYIANTGYGWGLLSGIGYGERLVEIFTEEITSGGTVTVGDVLTNTKTRYVLESPRLDAYDMKSLMQWTLYGLPMYSVQTGLARGGLSPFDDPAPEPWQVPSEEHLGPVRVEHELTLSGERSLPAHVIRFDTHIDLTAPGVYTKRNASGDDITGVPGCPDPLPGEPEGCYYTLNGLVERGSGDTDLPIQPYLFYDSRLAGTSQHGVLWKGGEYLQESDWTPVVAHLASNGGDGSNHGDAPRKIPSRPIGTGMIKGEDPADCRPSDLELNGLVVIAGEAVKELESDPTYTVERTYRGIDIEVFYYNNPLAPSENCDRDGPLFDDGPFDDMYHQLTGNTLEWAVPVTDTAEVWRVVVVWTDNTVDGQDLGAWTPLDLSYNNGAWRGTLDVSGEMLLTYVVQAVDNHGNVSWLEYLGTAQPASGVPLGVPLPIDVYREMIFSDGFEGGDTSAWSEVAQ